MILFESYSSPSGSLISISSEPVPIAGVADVRPADPDYSIWE